MQLSLYSSLCIYWKWPNKLYKFQLVLAVSSCFVIQLCLGLFVCYGNLLPYLVSYIRQRSHPQNLRTKDGLYLFVTQCGAFTVCTIIGGSLINRLGLRVVTIIGGAFIVLGVASSYYTIEISFYALFLTYGVVYASGVGLIYTGPYAYTIDWLPKWKGIGTAIIGSGFEVSALLFNTIMTGYVNPHNESPDDGAPYSDSVSERYFTQPGILDRVQEVFLILASCSAILLVLGSVVLVKPHPDYDMSDFSSSKTGKETSVTQNGKDRKRTSNSPQYRELKSFSDDASTIGDNKANASNSHNQKPCSTSNEDSKEISPLKMLSQGSFYILWVKIMIGCAIETLIITLCKSYGLELITGNDYFVTTTLTVGIVIGLSGRFVFALLDYFTDTTAALVVQSSVMSIFLLTFFLTSVVGEVLYFFWVCGLFFCLGGFFSLYPIAVSQCFGNKNLSANLGILFSAGIFGDLFTAFLSQVLIDNVGWSGIFLIFGTISCIDMMLCLFLHCFI